MLPMAETGIEFFKTGLMQPFQRGPENGIGYRAINEMVRITCYGH